MCLGVPINSIWMTGSWLGGRKGNQMSALRGLGVRRVSDSTLQRIVNLWGQLKSKDRVISILWLKTENESHHFRPKVRSNRACFHADHWSTPGWLGDVSKLGQRKCSSPWRCVVVGKDCGGAGSLWLEPECWRHIQRGQNSPHFKMGSSATDYLNAKGTCMFTHKHKR